MKFRVVLEYDQEIESYAVYCLELPGCTSAGGTEREAIENIREAIALYLEPNPIEIKGQAKVLEVEVSV